MRKFQVNRGFIRQFTNQRRSAMNSSDVVLMVSPDSFQFNFQTGVTNTFQKNLTRDGIAEDALSEFTSFRDTLRSHGVRVLTMRSRTDLCTPDAVFPNNWFSIHKMDQDETGVTSLKTATPTSPVTLVLYPMLNENRRSERQVDELTRQLQDINIRIAHVVDLTYFEAQGKALEGTGSLVLDRVNKIAYASISPRLDEEILSVWAQQLGYRTVTFRCVDKHESTVYHTNVMMSVGTGFAVVCVEGVRDEIAARQLIESLRESGKTIIEISCEQMAAMCGNILEIRSEVPSASSAGFDSISTRIVMSQTAFHAFTTDQIRTLERFGQLVPVSIPTIETVGGGSARCMLAEVFH